MPRYLVSRSGLRAYASSLITDEITVVLLPDALAAVAAIEQQHGEQSHGHYMDGYAAGLSAARDAVAALPWKVAVSFGPIDCNQSCEHGPCSCSGVMRPEAWTTGPDDALAAIDALRGES